jgi:hypothetical protein
LGGLILRPACGDCQVKCNKQGGIARQKNDHPGYSCEKTHWVFVTGVEPLNCHSAIGGALRLPFNNHQPAHNMRMTCAYRQSKNSTKRHRLPLGGNGSHNF